jgi:divalent metal cation (Fe/Co/Zn/Cd) transporter
MIVVFISVKLGRRAIDALLDKAPEGMHTQIVQILSNNPEIKSYHDLRVRTAGADHFVDVTIHLNPMLGIRQAHRVSQQVEEMICQKIKRCAVQVHYEPDVE